MALIKFWSVPTGHIGYEQMKNENQVNQVRQENGHNGVCILDNKKTNS